MPFKQTRHLLTISDLSKEELLYVIDLAMNMKKNRENYHDRLKQKTLLAFFAKPSLRTRVSLETAMTNLGGHCIYYELGDKAPLGVKETMQDTSEVISRMVDIVSARLPNRKMMSELAQHASVPCLNALDDWAHPLQMVCDFMSIKEHFGTLNDITMTFAGDCENNVTYDIMRACAILGMKCRIACPNMTKYKPVKEVLDEVEKLNKISGGSFEMFHDLHAACTGADVVYCDSWMSYHIDKTQREARFNELLPFQVDDKAMAKTSARSIFMNCLPAQRGEEQTAEVIDGPKSIIYTQAGNRLWSAMAVLDFFVNGKK